MQFSLSKILSSLAPNSVYKNGASLIIVDDEQILYTGVIDDTLNEIFIRDITPSFTLEHFQAAWEELIGELKTKVLDKVIFENNLKTQLMASIQADLGLVEEVPFTKLVPEAVFPTKATEHSVGWDLTAISIEDIGNNTIMLHTGIAVACPEGYYLELMPRSSTVKTPFFLANSVGIIDTDYRGELKIALKYLGEMPPLELPWRCAQIILKRDYSKNVYLTEVGSLEETQRGVGGFGSTGRV